MSSLLGRRIQRKSLMLFLSGGGKCATMPEIEKFARDERLSPESTAIRAVCRAVGSAPGGPVRPNSGGATTCPTAERAKRFRSRLPLEAYDLWWGGPRSALT